MKRKQTSIFVGLLITFIGLISAPIAVLIYQPEAFPVFLLGTLLGMTLGVFGMMFAILESIKGNKLFFGRYRYTKVLVPEAEQK